MCLEWSEIKKGNAIMIDRLDMSTVKMHAMHNPYFAILYSTVTSHCHATWKVETYSGCAWTVNFKKRHGPRNLLKIRLDRWV